MRTRVLEHKGNKSEDDDAPKVKWPCAICRNPLHEIIIASNPDVTYDKSALATAGNVILPIKKYGVICADRDSYAAAQDTTLIKCRPDLCRPCAEGDPPKSDTFRSWQDYNRYLSRVHQLFTCEVCVDFLKLFPDEHQTYTRKQLVKHRREKNEKGLERHPLCKFCDKRYFDPDQVRCFLLNLAGVNFAVCVLEPPLFGDKFFQFKVPY